MTGSHWKRGSFVLRKPQNPIKELSMNYRNRRGFTFLEIMFVVVIIGILLTLVVTNITSNTGKARETATKAKVESLANAVRHFYLDTGKFPGKLVEIVKKPDVEGWDGPYLSKPVLPLDEWSNAFEFCIPAQRQGYEFEIGSVGPDGKSGTSDDIGNWVEI